MSGEFIATKSHEKSQRKRREKRVEQKVAKGAKKDLDHQPTPGMRMDTNEPGERRAQSPQ